MVQQPVQMQRVVQQVQVPVQQVQVPVQQVQVPVQQVKMVQQPVRMVQQVQMVPVPQPVQQVQVQEVQLYDVPPSPPPMRMPSPVPIQEVVPVLPRHVFTHHSMSCLSLLTVVLIGFRLLPSITLTRLGLWRGPSFCFS